MSLTPPHVGQITAEGCLLPLPEAPEIARGSLGLSYPSYRWEGRQWACPIDAAAQVQAIRPDLIDRAPASWAELMDLARRGGVAIPLRPPHVLMSFFTLIANSGHPCRNEGCGPLIDRQAGITVLQRLSELVSLVDPACFCWDPIDVLDRMAGGDIACSPLVYGYVSYSGPRAHGHPLQFHDIPAIRPFGGVGGSALGGTGIAVSAFSAHPEAAIAFARHVAGPQVQTGIYAGSGGQVGHRDAWHDPAVDAGAGGFYSGTIRSLESAWLRPRHDGYTPFQQAASQRLNVALGDGGFGAAIDALERLFAATLVTSKAERRA